MCDGHKHSCNVLSAKMLSYSLAADHKVTHKRWTGGPVVKMIITYSPHSFRLEEQRRYYFELIYKHSDRGSDHVEVAVSIVDC